MKPPTNLRSIIASLAALLFAPTGVLAQPSTAATTPAAPSLRAVEYVPDSSAAFLPFDDAWPRRWNREIAPGVGELRSADRFTAQGVVHPLDVKVSRLGTRRVGRLTPMPDAGDLAAFRELADGAPNVDALVPQFENLNSIVFQLDPTPKARAFSNGFGVGIGPGTAAGPDASLVFQFVSGQLVAPTDANSKPAGNARTIQLQRTWFAYYEPLGDEHTPRDARGNALTKAAVLIMPGMFGTPETSIDPLTLRLRKNGFGVLRMLSQPSRFTEHSEIEIDLRSLDVSAARMALVVNDRVGECAYAADAAWDYVHSKRPAVAAVPHAILGISGGAITLPPVVALRPSRYSACVLIGGGADFWLINEQSNYKSMIDAVRSVWVGGLPTAGSIAEFDSELLLRARIDAFHTAAALKPTKVLVLHATADRAVPSPLGDVLWERLGRPERWTYPANHEMLCLGLPAEFDKLLVWLDDSMGFTKPAPEPAHPK